MGAVKNIPTAETPKRNKTPDPLLVQPYYLAVAMSRHGGGFLAALSEALLRADESNQHRILITWEEEIKKAFRIWWEREGNTLGSQVFKF